MDISSRWDILGPCQNHSWHSFTSCLSRALKVSRLGQCHLKGQSNPKISNFLLTQNKQQIFLTMIIAFISSKAQKLTQKRRSKISPLYENFASAHDYFACFNENIASTHANFASSHEKIAHSLGHS